MCFFTQGVVSLILTGRRARVLALKLRNISQMDDCSVLVITLGIGRRELRPDTYLIYQTVKEFVQDEFWRIAAIAYVSQPKGTRQKGWGAPGKSFSVLVA